MGCLMLRRYPVFLLVSTVVLLATSYLAWGTFHLQRLPFLHPIVDNATAVIDPIPGVALPAGLKAGDAIDLAALDPHSRYGIYSLAQPAGATYDFAIRHPDGSRAMVRVTVEAMAGVEYFQIRAWSVLCTTLLGAGVGLLLLWRGRDRAALGAALWLLSFLVGNVFSRVPADGGLPFLATQLTGLLFHLTARVGFYILIEAMMGASLSARARNVFRTLFVITLVVAGIEGTALFTTYPLIGWATPLVPRYGYLITASFLPPALLLVWGYGLAAPSERLRLRWVIVSTLCTVFAILLSNTPVLGPRATSLAATVFASLGQLGFLYAVLRHRILDLAVLLDRTLVYGGVTTLVVGVIAAMNSLALRATLGEGAGLLLQIVVPLALGIILGRVRIYMDRLVEQVFFRRKFLAERALRRFADGCGHIRESGHLFAAAVEAVARTTGSPAVALYLPVDSGYVRAQQTGAPVYPPAVDADDPALVAARAERDPVDLATLVSVLGPDGCVFPMTVLGVDQGMLVLANRPGEQYPSDERALLAKVASDVGAAWRIIKARENEAFVRGIVKGEIKLKDVRSKARKLELAWSETST